MRRFLVALGFGLLAVVAHAAHAQDTYPPILALNTGGIYAVSPADGSACTLVAPHPDYNAIHHLWDPVTTFSAEWLSPDGRYLAYRTMYPDAFDRLQSSGHSPSHALFVLDTQNGGESLPVSLVDNATETSRVYVESLAWSAAGTRLYVVISTYDVALETVLGWSLVYVDRDTWDAPTFVPLPAPEYAMARRIFAIDQGVVVFDRGIQSPRYTFMVLDPDGQPVTEFKIDSNVSSAVNLYVNTLFTPLLVDGSVRFGLVHWLRGDLIYQVDFESSTTVPFASGYFPSMVSGLAPDTSLRITLSHYDCDALALLIRDADLIPVGDTPVISAYAFGISFDNSGSTSALSPDGQALAYLDHGTLMLWQDGSAAPVGFTTEAIVWGPSVNLPLYDPNALVG